LGFFYKKNALYKFTVIIIILGDDASIRPCHGRQPLPELFQRLPYVYDAQTDELLPNEFGSGVQAQAQAQAPLLT